MFLNTVFSCNLSCLFLVQFFSLSHVTFDDYFSISHLVEMRFLLSFVESLGPFVVVTLVGPADAS